MQAGSLLTAWAAAALIGFAATAAEPAAKPAPEAAWGETVAGLQCRAWVDESVVGLGWTLKVHYELRNAGERAFSVLRYSAPPAAYVEWLDRKSKVNPEQQTATRQGIAADDFVTLKPGESFRADCESYCLHGEEAEARTMPARLRVAYRVFPNVTRDFPAAWGPARGQKEPLCVYSDAVPVTLRARMPGEDYYTHVAERDTYSLDAAWLTAMIVVRGRITSQSAPRRVEPRVYDDADPEAGAWRDVTTKEPLAVRLLREGNGLRVLESLKGDAPQAQLVMDYATHPVFERPLAVDEEVVAFLTWAGGDRWRLIKAVAPADFDAKTLARLRALPSPAWGEPNKGLACCLVAPAGPVTAATPLKFTLALCFDPKSADPAVTALDRYKEYAHATEIQFKNVATGKVWTRCEEEPMGGPPVHMAADCRVLIRSEPLAPLSVSVSLVAADGETVPPGDYRVTATYMRELVQGDFQRHPWKRSAWIGTVASGAIPLRIEPAKPVVVELPVPTGLILKRCDDGFDAAPNFKEGRKLKSTLRPGFQLMYNTRTEFYHGQEKLTGGDGGGNGPVFFDESRVSYGIGGVHGRWDIAGFRAEDVRMVARVQVFETPRYYDFTGKTVRVIWEGAVEGALAPAAVADAVSGVWSRPVGGVSSRLSLDHIQCKAGAGIGICLDARNDSTNSVQLFTSTALKRSFRIIGPDNQLIEQDSDIRDDEGWGVYELAPGKEQVACFLHTKKNYRLTKPGRYRVEWAGLRPDEPAHGGVAPPPAPAVFFEVVAADTKPAGK